MHRLNMSRYTFIILLVIVLSLVVNGYIYYSVLGSAQDDLTRVEGQLEQEERLLQALEERVEREQDASTVSTEELQELLPSEALVDQFILDLRRAEAVSGGVMLDLSFARGDLGEVVFYRDEEEENIDEETEGIDAEGENGEVVSDEEANYPEGIQKLSVNMGYRATSYGDLLNFLYTMESFERITKVDNISFSGTRGDEFNVNLTISTFYGEGLDDLTEDLPTVDHEEPSNKSNPLPRSIDED